MFERPNENLEMGILVAGEIKSDNEDNEPKNDVVCRYDYVNPN